MSGEVFPCLQRSRKFKRTSSLTASTISIMSRHRDEYRQWPFLNQEEFELACAFFDQRYVRASLGPTRQIFKIRSRRTLTTGNSYIEILRLLQLPEDEDELSLALSKLGNGGDGLNSGSGMEIDTTEEDADEVSKVLYFIILRDGHTTLHDRKILTRDTGSPSESHEFRHKFQRQAGTSWLQSLFTPTICDI